MPRRFDELSGEDLVKLETCDPEKQKGGQRVVNPLPPFSLRRASK